jgi:kynurenine formamidase
MKYIDLSHTFSKDMPVYPGDSLPELTQVSDFGDVGHVNYMLKSGIHVGTHIDAPYHMVEGGKKLSEINVENFFGRGVLIDARGVEVISAELLEKSGGGKVDILLVMTGFGSKFKENDYYKKYPVLSEDFARRAVELGVKIVGLDTPSPDREPYTVHRILLGKEILIIENLTNLDQLIGVKEFEVVALPAKFEAEAGFARIVAKVAS